MRRTPPALLRDIMGVVWAVFMLDLIFVAVGALLTPHLGAGLAFGLFGGLALASTGVFALLTGANLLYIAVMRLRERGRR